MDQFEVDISPKELYTHNRNDLHLTISEGDIRSIREIRLSLVYQVQARYREKDRILVCSQRFAGSDIPAQLPASMEWLVEIPNTGPVTFESKAFLIIYSAQIEIVIPKRTFAREIPLLVIPGKIRADKMKKE
jgi:hypothetical protein